ncbi:DeoR/GlpR family DNA-binding transcription regulator [Leucothrix mucor]|uniref:DeoR/GlpR family DNA-binding transcription regulator n=1 Tax=Leucothrix mucor TaxID=45248 RepID=UPI0003B5BC5E|nr:DeoR/GlpR family DNA-binding transcription regulator [Leucothrix mucor]
MNERQRHKKILNMLSQQSIVTVHELETALDASIATVRRDINTLAAANLAQKIRGGIEVVTDKTPAPPRLAGNSFNNNETLHVEEKRAVAREATALCQDGESIIINGGTSTYRMAEFLEARSLHILTNSFTMADYLLRRSNNQVTLPGGEVYRAQNIILSPYEDDTAVDHFYASKMFIGAYAIRQQGLIEADPLLIKAEQKLLKQAEQLIVLVDSSKFETFGSLILCPLDRIDTVITDNGVKPDSVKMLEKAGIEVIVASSEHQTH